MNKYRRQVKDAMENSEKSMWFKRGIHDGIPISLGYLAAALTIGIAAKNGGLTAVQATIASLTNNASAGEFVGFTLIAAKASLIEVALMILITNARYLLMSCSLSQKLPSDTPLAQRLIIGWDITDEIFSAAMAIPNKLDPWYLFGMMAITMPGWAAGTYIGVVMGNVLADRVVRALSIGLYGMFLYFLVPAARKSRIVGGVILVSMLCSLAFTLLPVISEWSSGNRTILLTVGISALAAILFPVSEEA